jgi:transcriptional regulator with XRE-family HTH domain
MALVASISDRVGDLGAYLREQRETARLSVRQLASLTGVSNPYLSQVERGLRRPSAEVLQQLAKGLRISAEALYVRAGILDDGPRGTVEAAVEADEGLTPRQKKVLLELCAHFRSENARAETTPDDVEPASTPAKTRTKAGATARTKAAGATARTKGAGTTARTKAAGTTARTKVAGATARTKASATAPDGPPTNPHPENGTAASSR